MILILFRLTFSVTLFFFTSLTLDIAGWGVALSAQSVPDEERGEDSTDFRVDALDSTLHVEPRVRRVKVSPRLVVHPTIPSSTTLKPLLQNPIASFQDLLYVGGSIQPYDSRVPTGPSSVGHGSLGPGSAGFLIEGRRPLTADRRFVEPSVIPILRIEEAEELRGVDASLYGEIYSDRLLNIRNAEYDVQGSYLRVGYTGAPGGVSRVALLFARNISSDLTVSSNFRRLSTEGFLAAEAGDQLAGDLQLDFYPDEESRLRLAAEVLELDRQDNGGLDDFGITRGPTVAEERRRRRIGLDYFQLTDVDRERAKGERSIESFVAGTIAYDHDARYVTGLAPGDTIFDRGDFLSVSGSATQIVGAPLFVRAHLEGTLRNERLDVGHVGGMLGVSSGPIRAELGTAATLHGTDAGDTDLQSALLTALSGEHGDFSWRLDGRYFPAVNPQSPFNRAVLDSGGGDYLVDSWIVEGLITTGDSITYYGLDLAIRRSSEEEDYVTGIDAFIAVASPIGPVQGRVSLGYMTTYGVEGLNPLFSGDFSVGVPFELFGGALDIFAQVSGCLRSKQGGYRFDEATASWYSDRSDRVNPAQLKPHLAGALTARIGSAFFTFEFVNLLNSEYWTTRRRPETGFGLQFGLNWVLID